MFLVFKEGSPSSEEAALADPLHSPHRPVSNGAQHLRVATFNVSLFGKQPGTIITRVNDASNQQVRHIIAALAEANPDVVLINELDFDPAGEAANALARRLSLALPDQAPFTAQAFPSNTGIPTGLDVLGKGRKPTPENAFGFGEFPGQYGFALLSRFPVTSTRSFQHFLWRDMPGARLPDQRRKSGKGDFFAPAVLEVFRLSSKNHVDAVIDVPTLGPLHLLLSHPTPPVFDGPEQRNRRRNHDEIRLWADYLRDADYLVDDAGQRGGLPPDSAPFIILGDLNADPDRGDSEDQAIAQLLHHPRVADPEPRGAHGTRTADFRHQSMRVDYVLPCRSLSVHGSGVAWFAKDDPRARWNSASDHHLVWVDVLIP